MTYRSRLEAMTERLASLEAELSSVETLLRSQRDLARERDRLRVAVADTSAVVREERGRRHLPILARSAQIHIATPCEARWENMVGDERVRRCGHCDSDVYDLGAHTAEEVDALVVRATEKPCVRFFRRSDGTILTRDCAEPQSRESGDTGSRIAGAVAGLTAVGLVAGGVAIATLPQLGRSYVTQSRSDALEVRSAVLLYMGQGCGADCPTMDDLQKSEVIDRSRRTTDAWDTPFVVECDGDDIRVFSAGPDRTYGTEDDIRPE